jgi:hypothetical protein
MMLAQNGRCAICMETPDKQLHVDHNHYTGLIRGLLCGKCNAGIGLLKDDSDLCMRATQYLGVQVDENEWATEFEFLYRARPYEYGKDT